MSETETTQPAPQTTDTPNPAPAVGDPPTTHTPADAIPDAAADAAPYGMHLDLPRPKRGPGRNRKRTTLDIQRVYDLASGFHTQEEIAVELNCCVRTLKNSRAALDAYQKGRDKAKLLLRSLQLRTARNGNTAMQIWLGKNYLDQQDRVATQAETHIVLDYARDWRAPAQDAQDGLQQARSATLPPAVDTEAQALPAPTHDAGTDADAP